MAWRMGSSVDGSDSQAEEIAPAAHWPEMRALILVVSADKKGVSSTAGMQATVQTSRLFRTRAEEVVPRTMQEMETAIRKKDFETFARVTMAESNSFHATCLDTVPPIFYLNDVSRAAIRVVEGINEGAERAVAAYTFDAGPNAVVYFVEEEQDKVLGALGTVLAAVEGWPVQGRMTSGTARDSIDEKAAGVLKTGVNRVIYTKVGEGPIRTEEHLVGETGEPIRR